MYKNNKSTKTINVPKYNFTQLLSSLLIQKFVPDLSCLFRVAEAMDDVVDEVLDEIVEVDETVDNEADLCSLFVRERVWTGSRIMGICRELLFVELLIVELLFASAARVSLALVCLACSCLISCSMLL